MKNTIIKDEKGREIININNNGKMAVARFPDMSDAVKECIIELYKDMTNEDIELIKDFLEYKTEDNQFCA